jgi:hypothetical protein
MPVIAGEVCRESVFSSALIMDETLLAQDSEGFVVWGVRPEGANALTRAFHAGQDIEPLEFDITMTHLREHHGNAPESGLDSVLRDFLTRS